MISSIIYFKSIGIKEFGYAISKIDQNKPNQIKPKELF